LVLTGQGRLTMFYLLPDNLYRVFALGVPARTIFFSLMIIACYKVYPKEHLGISPAHSPTCSQIKQVQLLSQTGP
jgi:hypothetical protein